MATTKDKSVVDQELEDIVINNQERILTLLQELNSTVSDMASQVKELSKHDKENQYLKDKMKN